MSFLDELFGRSRNGNGLNAVMLAAIAGTAPAAFAQNAGLGNIDSGDVYENSLDAMFNGEDAGAINANNGGEALDDLDFEVEVNEFDLVDLHVNNEDLAKVLQLLSIQSQRNIIASPNVSATVTADLYGVTFYEALEAILHVNGFGFQERGNFIYVYTREEIAAIEQAARQRVSTVFALSYLNAIDAAEFGKQLLSADGSITTSVATEAFQINSGNPTGADSYAHQATVVINDYQENVDAIVALLDELDARPDQVLVEATILQTTLNEANAFGVDFAVLNNMDFADFVGIGGPLQAVTGLITGQSEDIAGNAILAPQQGNGSAIGTNVGDVAGNATFRAGIVNEDVAVFLRLLDEVTDVTVVSNPKILTLNRQPARVLVGTKVGYLNTTTTDTATTQTVEFLDVGTELSVRPFVSDNGLIRLELTPKVSSAQLREVTGLGSAPVTIPDEDTTELTTNVMLRDGQTAVLGGLFTETTTASRKQVPLFGDIPIIGNAFRGYDDSTRRSEIIFMITPSIVNDGELAESGELAQDYVNYARVGARKGTLLFSRDRQVGRLLIKARQLAEQGQRDEALFKVQRALALSPSSADAHALRAKLSGDEPFQPSRSLMEDMLHGELTGSLGEAAFGEPNFSEPGFAEPQFSEPEFSEPQFTEAETASASTGEGEFAEPIIDIETAEAAPTTTPTDESFEDFGTDPSFQDGEAFTEAPIQSEANAEPTAETFTEPAQPEASTGPVIAIESVGGTPAATTGERGELDWSQPLTVASSTDGSTDGSDAGMDQYASVPSDTVVVEEIVIGDGPRPSAETFETSEPTAIASSEQPEAIDSDWLLEGGEVASAEPVTDAWAAMQGLGVLLVPMPHGGMVQVPWPVSGDDQFIPYNGSFTTAPINSTDLSDDVNR